MSLSTVSLTGTKFFFKILSKDFSKPDIPLFHYQFDQLYD